MRQVIGTDLTHCYPEMFGTVDLVLSQRALLWPTLQQHPGR